MKTKKLIVTTIVCVFSITGVYAQRVETALLDGNPVINCTEMPSAAITATPKGNTEAVLKTADANATVFQRFAVAKADNNASSQSSPAFTACSDLGAGWRLPTQRELMLMWVLKAELEKASGFTKFTVAIYWSATEYGGYGFYSRVVNFTNGTTNFDFKTATYRVRCLKEL